MLRDASRPAEAVTALEQALALLPPARTTRAHAVVLAALARSLTHVTDMQATPLTGDGQRLRPALPPRSCPPAPAGNGRVKT